MTDIHDHRYFNADTSFNLLMQKRIRKVLVICSSYDFFMLEEDGRIDERVFNEYVSLNLRYPPAFIHASSAKRAFELIESEDIDLVIEMLSIGDVDAFELAKQLKARNADIPIVILTHFSREVSLRLELEDLSAIDHMFSWLGNQDLFLAIIKLIEDRMNAPRDIGEIGVQGILLIEDSIRYISSYLPFLYRIIFEQTKEFTKEALNEHQQMLRRRGRPKVLLAKSYKEAMELYTKYKNNILGVISDVSYKKAPNKRDTKSKAGVKFCKMVLGNDPNKPFILQSSDVSNEEIANTLNVGFLNKYSKNLSNELKEYMLEEFGFGDFVFKDPKTLEEKYKAHNLKSLQELLRTIPDDMLEYHTRRDDFSKWLNARALFPIAKKFKEASYEDFGNANQVRKYIYDAIAVFRVSKARGIIAEFDKNRFDEYTVFSRIGEGTLGGKARGLAFMNSVIKNKKLYDKYKDIHISVPPTIVLSTEVFEEFIDINKLHPFAMENHDDEVILNQFIDSEFPVKIKEDLLAIAGRLTKPVAIRSSSKLEDSFFQPFAGIYNTYMISPHKNVSHTAKMLEEAIKCVYASVYFSAGKSYMTSTSNLIDEEKMGIIIQTVCGSQKKDLFYPAVSGVGRSINYYPIGPEKPGDGIVNIAYGLGKLIVDGENTLRFCPRYPKKIMQLSSTDAALKDTQKHFYGLLLEPGKFHPSVDDRVNLTKLRIAKADDDPALDYLASSYDMDSDILRDGTNLPGKKVLTFANILNHNTLPLAEIMNELLVLSQQAMNNPVEIEFAIDLNTPSGKPKEFNYLQVRPIVSNELSKKHIIDKIDKKSAIVYSEKALGNGIIKDIRNIVYIVPENFNSLNNVKIAAELDALNKMLSSEKTNYILIGPGRWGSSDPALGIPVKWNNITGARIIIECGLKDYRIEPSQGTHFFHNITSFGVGYFTINPYNDDGICDFSYLNSIIPANQTSFIRHLSLPSPVRIEIDGRNNKGVVCRPVT